ncbi:MAG: hypothetical protein A2091_05390 [Desulfuromonadales bacterium GWD2_61_12]|nr:MAG: hypothetical protein A2005_03440 [Desulfuromonadales bacterium GWC2_61_20]OGR36050.1 MAG: hypothetical protein A2091_05390 [Desulfuromonadales bacterium GWD2_61_12]HAD03212.1 hypothetical protein [Desulfuromonas sp.]HBT82479.1 hypothetical protein [Desulfuromonas sp.]
MRVSPEVAKIVAPGVARDLQLTVAQGKSPLTGSDLVTALFFFCRSPDAEIKGAALLTLRHLPASILVAMVGDAALHPQLLHFLAQVRLQDPQVMSPLLGNPGLTEATAVLVAGRCGAALMPLLLENAELRSRFPGIDAALVANPALPPALAERLTSTPAVATAAVSAAPGESREVKDEAADENEEDEEKLPEEEINLSKYQQALEMEVSAKIKMAITGDKEWRAIFLKDPNKLVHGAVLKNPRITDGEVLALAKNKTSSDEMIRIILLNREWTKNLTIKAALVLHPKTPAPQALRFMNFLDLKVLKKLAKSKGVSQVVVNAARRMAADKDKKR